ncbi:MAG: 16S rRNA (cytosine(1402)-N(4))-methyltransferase RsmH [Patescibacteria group bacterium]
MKHISVLMDEVIANLDPHPGESFVDATANGGGHFFEIARRIEGGMILGIEADPEIAEKLKLKSEDSGIGAKMIVVSDSYENIKNILEGNTFGQANGILFDLGFSSVQLEHSGRGFSFQKDEPLDMRFDPVRNTLRASDIVNHGTREELEKILKEYGEERYARKIADAIAESRKRRAIQTTFDLISVLQTAIPGLAQRGRIHFATRTFQALRIAVNNEFEVIRRGIVGAIDCLKPGGRVLVITFHSSEDRIVKFLFKDKEKEGIIALVHKKPIVPTRMEVSGNNRARSAKLRVAEKQ